jgi:putative tryptophan/tyrosine transport system substrate-binding protein
VGLFILLPLFLIASGYILFTALQNRQINNAHKIYHVGILSAVAYFYPQVDSFKQALTKLGYVEGQNIDYDIQTSPNPVGNQQILQKFVQNKVDLILVFPTEASLEAKEVTKGTNIPVITTAAYLDDHQLIDTISHPGGNLTGVRFPITDTAAKRLELLHQIAPLAKRIWIPYLKDYPTVAPSLMVIRPIAAALNLTLIETPFTNPVEMTTYLTSKIKGNHDMDAILMIPEPLGITPAFFNQVYEFAGTHQIPIVSATILDDDTGPILGLIASNAEYGNLAAALANKILKGAKAGDLPVVTPENELQLNYLVIQKLGIFVDPGILSQAKKIVH